MSKKKSSLDFQMDETNFDTEWKWNNVSEDREKKLVIFFTKSREPSTRVSQTKWKESLTLNQLPSETLEHDKEDKDTLTTD